MSIAMQNELNALRTRVESLEGLLRQASDNAKMAIVPAHLATKDDLDAFLTRFRSLEAQVEALKRKVKV